MVKGNETGRPGLEWAAGGPVDESTFKFTVAGNLRHAAQGPARPLPGYGFVTILHSKFHTSWSLALLCVGVCVSGVSDAVSLWLRCEQTPQVRVSHVTLRLLTQFLVTFP